MVDGFQTRTQKIVSRNARTFSIKRTLDQDNITLRFEDSQLKRTLAAMAPQSPPAREGIKIETAAKLIEIIAILAAGAWALVMFFSHERELQQTQLRQANLSLEQAQILSNSQTKAAELNVRALELETKLKGIEFDSAKQTPMKIDMDVTLERAQNSGANPADYVAHVKVTAKNMSKLEAVVKRASLTVFLGEMSPQKGASYATKINSPAERSGPENQRITSPIKWVAKEDIKYAYDGLPSIGSNERAGGFAFGRLQREEEAYADAQYGVHGGSHMWVGFIIQLTWAPESNDADERVVLFSDYRRLSSADEPDEDKKKFHAK